MQQHKDLYLLPWFLTFFVSLSGLSTDIYLPSMPAMITLFHTDYCHVQMTLTFYMLGFAVCMLLSGPFSDRFGRKSVVLIGLAIYFFSTLLCYVATSIEMLIVGRFFQALGGCCGTVIARVIVKETYCSIQGVKVLAWISSGMALSAAIAPVIGSIICIQVNWRLNFLLLAGLSFILFFCFYFFYEESIIQKNTKALNLKNLFGSYTQALKDTNFLYYTLIISFAWSGLFAFISASSFIFIDMLKMSLVSYGIIYGVIIASYITGTWLTRRLANHPNLSLKIGIALSGTASLIILVSNLAFTLKIFTILVPMMIYLMGIGMIMPNAQYVALQFCTNSVGTVAGLLYFVEMLFGFVVGYIISYSYNFYKFTMVSLVFLSALFIVIIFYYLTKNKIWSLS